MIKSKIGFFNIEIHPLTRNVSKIPAYLADQPLDLSDNVWHDVLGCADFVVSA